VNLGKKISDFNFIYTFQNPHEKLNRAFLLKKLLRCLGSWKTSNISGPFGGLSNTPPHPHLLYLSA
jgi:hypothetical protein